MSNKNEEIENEKMKADIDVYMEDFKKFIEDEIGKDPEQYDDLAYQIIELMSLNDAFVTMLMQMQKAQQQQEQQQGSGKQLYVPEEDGIVTG